MVSRSLLPHSTRGFTMVELLVVVAIMAILAVVASPSIGNALARQQIKSATFELAQALQTARNTAVLYRRTVDVRASYPTSSTNNQWNGLNTGSLFSTNVTTADQTKIAKTSFYTLQTGTAIDNATATDNVVTQIATVNSKVVINSDAIVIRFRPDSSVQIATTTTGALTPLTANRNFVITSTGYSDTGYTVSLTVSGAVRVVKNA